MVTTRDLAKLYACHNGTKAINQAVKRNIERFPNDFYFQLTYEEYRIILRSQNVTLELKQGQFSKYLPFVFTEQGVAMLSSVLKTEVAASVSVSIMREFVIMRKYISANLIEQKYINKLVLEHDESIKLIHQTLSQLEERKKINEIYFDGQIYDAYSKIVDIFKTATKELTIIDSYADKTVLDMISKLAVKVTLIVKAHGLLTNIDIQRYLAQYKNLKVIYNETFHDRYFIIDKKTIYHCGTSINHAGNKTFSINILEDTFVKNSLIKKIDTIT